MSETRKDAPMGYTQESFPGNSHVCLIYDDEGQRRKVVSEYLAAGLRRGELVRYIADAAKPEEIRSWLSEMGVELPDPERSGSFAIFDAESFYCPEGRFEPKIMIDGMPLRFESAKKAGYKGVRSTGEMSWALKGILGSERLLEYEAMLGTVGGDFPHLGMCQYDARLFDGATLYKVLQVHPYMIARGQVVSNPFYVRPGEDLPA